MMSVSTRYLFPFSCYLQKKKHVFGSRSTVLPKNWIFHHSSPFFSVLFDISVPPYNQSATRLTTFFQIFRQKYNTGCPRKKPPHSRSSWILSLFFWLDLTWGTLGIIAFLTITLKSPDWNNKEVMAQWRDRPPHLWNVPDSDTVSAGATKYSLFGTSCLC